MPTLSQKFQLYKKLFKKHQDRRGFIMSDMCDSLLFSGLVGCVGDVIVNISAAQDKDGSWHRRPLDLPPCYDCSREWKLIPRLKECWKIWKQTKSKKLVQKVFEKGGSTISRDMLVGLAWYALFHERLDISEGVIKYALKNKLIMGKGTPSRTFMTPGLLSTFAWISYRLGGPSRPWLRLIPQHEDKNVTGFQAHLSVLHIILRNWLTEKYKNLDILAHHANRQPNNPLFLWAAGDSIGAENLLMNEKWWPNDRLPDQADVASDWLLQRDYGPDWAPENVDPRDAKEHCGGDFLFAANLVLFYKPILD